MTDQHSDATPHTPQRATGRRPVPRALVLGLTVGVLLGTGGAVAASRALATTDSCAAGSEPLRVVVAPELSSALTSALQGAAVDDGFCLQSVEITSADPAETAAALRHGNARPDVWIPDSSAWLDALKADLPTLTTTPERLVTSPLVLALPSTVAEELTPGGRPPVTSLIPASGGAVGPVRWVLPKPQESAATVGALLALQDAVAERKDRSVVLTTVIRGSSQDAITSTEAANPEQPLATPMPEQRVYAHNLDHPGAELRASYPERDGFVFDYPIAVLAKDVARRTDAETLATTLRARSAQDVFTAAGFRPADGQPGSSEASPDRRTLSHVPDAAETSKAAAAYQAVLRPSRLLALIDVSGSMAKPVPGAGPLTRLNLATQAAVNGLAVYPDETAVGLWVFSSDLTPKTDYRELAPLQPLGRGADGVSGRERVAYALAGTTVTKGHTGLYDSVLAAVRHVRSSWDAERVNSVVVITDGGNSDKNGVSLDELVSTLKRENDPKRPVAVFAIAYGPESDLASLKRISAAAGGQAYAAPDPRMISAVLRDAIGRRACSPDC